MNFIKPFGLSVMDVYYKAQQNTFLNTRVENGNIIERAGNWFLSPWQFIFAPTTYEINKKLVDDREVREVKVSSLTTFNYENSHVLKTVLAILSLPITLIIGSTLKGLAYLSADTRANHRAIEVYKQRPFEPTNYKAFGVDQVFSKEAPSLQVQPREPIDEEDMKLFNVDKLAAKRVLEILDEVGIPCWADCGTALGIYRHEGRLPWDNDVDIAILAVDHQNVFRVLKKELEERYPGEYALQDWSAFTLPQSSFKMHIKENDSLIDFYTYRIIQPQDREISNTDSNLQEDLVEEITLTVGDQVIKTPNVDKKSVFNITPETTSVQFQFAEKGIMPESWKVRERACTLERPIESLFPLKRANFDGIELWVPNDTEKWLQRTYGILNPTKVYDPDSKKYIQVMGHPYWETHDFNSSLE